MEVKVNQDDTQPMSILTLQGPMFQPLLVSMAEGIHALTSESNAKMGKRLVHVLIELGQNILHHSDERVALTSGGSVGIGRLDLLETDDDWVVAATNLVRLSKVPDLESRCSQLNSKQENLKHKVMKTLKSPTTGHGGGIGLMHMARLSDSRIETRFIEKDSDRVSFEIKVRISKKANNHPT